MLVDGREVAPDTVLEADLCVIGAGAAGITIAQTFAGMAQSVLLLESGGFDSDAKTQELNDGEIVGLPLNPANPLALRDTRLRYFGGTTNHWAGACRPLTPWDFERRDWIPHSGWPVTGEEMAPWYDAAAELLLLPATAFDVARRAAELGTPTPLGRPRDFTTALQRSAPIRFGSQFRPALVDAANVRVCLWSNATKLVTDDSGRHVEAVECATLRGNRFRARARAYVLAMGAIEVPRLLLASNDAIPDGLGNQSGYVGACFMEHLIGTGGWVVSTAPKAELEFFTLLPAREVATAAAAPPYEPRVNGELIPTPDAMAREQLQNLAISLTLLVEEDAFANRRKLVGPRAVGELSSDVDQATTTAYASPLYIVGEQQPNPRSRVRLTNERDALGMPKVALDWRLRPADYERMLKAMLLAGEALGAQALGRLQIAFNEIEIRAADPRRELPERVPLNTGFHHMGTARMSASPRDGVTDANARLHTTDNLFVGGSALWTTSGVSPPTMSIVAFALRLADHLRQNVL